MALRHTPSDATTDTAPRTSPAPKVDPSEVRVRMYRALDEAESGDTNYRGLLGDCFLIQLGGEGRTATILIDCGMLLGSPDADRRMHAIATSIARTCGGDPDTGRPGTLDLLVVTHEHWDHISGFSQASEIFFDPARLDIRSIWMAWTEDPANEQARRLRARFDKTGFALSKIATRLRDDVAAFGPDVARNRLGGLDGFTGLAAESERDDAKSNGKERKGPRLRGRAVMERLKDSRTRFLTPGQVLRTPGAVSLPAFVLGPPQCEKRLFKDKPTASAPETYLDAPAVDGQLLMRFAQGEDPEPSRDSPFAPDYCRVRVKELEAALAAAGPCDARACEFLREHYYGTAGMSEAERMAMERRRIDSDWLGNAGAMALKLDSDTNNTSLVLAFELPDKDVMLFAADAQVGNWESWHDQRYAAEDGRIVTAEDLLARTRLYKVGHHGSHNATLSTRGLEMMTHKGLFAMIPTDEDLGKQQGSGWQMPNPRVKAALRQKTQGRILRNDRRYLPDGWRKNPETKDVDPGFFAGLHEEDLYLEYRLL